MTSDNGLSSESPLCKVPYSIMRPVINILDCDERWTSLATVIPVRDLNLPTGLCLNDIIKLRNCHSPTTELLVYWITQNPTVNDLIRALTQARQDHAVKVVIDSLGIESSKSLLKTIAVTSIDKNGANQGLNVQGLKHWSFNHIKVLTDNFNEKYLIGAGNFSLVYHCKQPDTVEVAIKVLKNDIGKQFESEIKVLSRFKHKNMVSLLGYSCDGCRNCLIYEYMKNGSLYDRLQCLKNSEPLSWKVRFFIARGVARALHYLHTSEETPYIHRDIKSTNILLDENFVSKVADFGLTRALSCNNDSSIMTAVTIGTSAYMSREASRGHITVKQDTFAFGVVLLELLTGLPAHDDCREDVDLLSHVQENYEDSITPLLDAKGGNWPIDITNRLFEIAKKCCEDNKKNRPFMTEVLGDIENLCVKIET